MTLMDTGEDIAAMETIRRGVHFSPELKEGIAAPWRWRCSRRSAR